MKIIDTTNQNEVFEFEKRVEELDFNQREKGEYDINDFVMVRTTDFLPEDHICKAICKVPFVTNVNSVATTAVYDILKEIYEDKSDEEFKTILNKYSPLSSQYRSTIHFSLNGLVTSHAQGNFDGKNFIIIDKLNKHLGVDNFRSIRMEDSFISGEFEISNEAILLIDESKYDQLVTKFPFLNAYNVVLFRGDDNLAVNMAISHMNIVPEKIGQHSAEYSERTQLYNNFLDAIEKKYGISQEKHYYSKEYKLDDEKNLLLWDIYDRDFYNKLFDYLGMDENQKQRIIDCLLSDYDVFTKSDIFKDIIIQMGVEKYFSFVINYNKNILEAIEQGNYPTNEDILAMGYIDIKNNNKTL